MSAPTRSDADPVREVRRMHLFVEDWLGGVREDLEPYADTLADDFSYVAPDGTIHDRDGAVASLSAAGGGYTDSSPPFAVDVRNVEHRYSAYDVHLVTYEARRRIDGDWETRIGSVWLHETDDSPTGLEWLHLHETRVDADGDSGDDPGGERMGNSTNEAGETRGER